VKDILKIARPTSSSERICEDLAVLSISNDKTHKMDKVHPAGAVTALHCTALNCTALHCTALH
jgi:hypothetical protein